MYNLKPVFYIYLFSLLAFPPVYAQHELPIINFMNKGFSASDVQVHDDYAFVKDGTDGLVVFDVINPAEPVLTGYFNFENNRDFNFSYHFGTVYISLKEDERNDYPIYIIDANDPANISIIDTIYGSTTSYCIKSFGDYAAWGRWYVDLRIPEEPVMLGYYNRLPYVYDVEEYDGHFVYACERYGVKTVSWADPENPVWVGNYNTGITVLSIEIIDHYVYVGTDTSGILVLDIEDIENPRLVGEYLDIPFIRPNLELVGEDLYFSGSGYLGLLDISDREEPVLVNLQDSLNCHRISINENTAFSTWSGALSAIDVSNREEFFEQAFIYSNFYNYRMDIHNDQLYVHLRTQDMDRNYEYKVNVIDLSDPLEPQVISTLTDSVELKEVIIRNDRLTGYYYREGIRIYDISDPNAFELMGRYESTEMYSIITVKDDILVLRAGRVDAEGEGESYIEILDISDPSNIESLGEIILSTRVVIVDVNLLFVSERRYGLRVFDIYGEDGPEQLFEFDTGQTNWGSIYIDSDRCYLPMADNSWVILDISDPVDISVLGEFNFGEARAYGFQIDGDRSYTCLLNDDGFFNNIYWYDMTDPEQIEVIDSLQVAGTPRAMQRIDDFLFVYHSGRGFSVVDISDPEDIRLVGFNTSATEIKQFAQHDQLVFSLSNSNIEIIDFSGLVEPDQVVEVTPNELHLFSAYPNPFNGSTTVSYNLSAPSFITIGIYDLSGRRIETLINERQTAGNHTISLNANSLASGMYLIRAETSEWSRTQKIILIK